MGALHSVGPMTQQKTVSSVDPSVNIQLVGHNHNNRTSTNPTVPPVKPSPTATSNTAFEAKGKSLEDEISNLRKTIESLESENRRLQSERSSWFWEFESIRSELVQSQRQLRDSPSARNVISREDLVVPFPTSPLCKTPSDKFLGGPKLSKSNNSVDLHVIPPSPAFNSKPQFFTFSEDHVAIYNASATSLVQPTVAISAAPVIKTEKCGCIPVAQRSNSFVRGLVVISDHQCLQYKRKFCDVFLPEFATKVDSAGLIFHFEEFMVESADPFDFSANVDGIFTIITFVKDLNHPWIHEVYLKPINTCNVCGQCTDAIDIQSGIFCQLDTRESEILDKLREDKRSQMVSLAKENWLDNAGQLCLTQLQANSNRCNSIDCLASLLESDSNYVSIEGIFHGGMDSCFGQSYQDSVLERLLKRTTDAETVGLQPYIEQLRSFVEPNLIYPKVLVSGGQDAILSVLVAKYVELLHRSDSFMVLYHFTDTGCSITCDPVYMIRRFCQMLAKLIGNAVKIPMETQKLRAHCVSLLDQVTTLQNDGIVLIIDGFDCILGWEETLKWLLESLPHRVHLVVTTINQPSSLDASECFQHKISLLLTQSINHDDLLETATQKVLTMVSLSNGCLSLFDLKQLLPEISDATLRSLIKTGVILVSGGLLSLPKCKVSLAFVDRRDVFSQQLLSYWSDSRRTYCLRSTIGKLSLLTQTDTKALLLTLKRPETFVTLCAHGMSESILTKLQSCQVSIGDALKIFFDQSDLDEVTPPVISCLKMVALGAVATHYDSPISWAVRCYQRALEIFQVCVDPDHLFVGFIEFHMALTFFNCGRLSLSESLFKRALRIQQASLGPSHTRVIETLEALCHNFQCQNKLSACEAVQQLIQRRINCRSDSSFASSKKRRFRSLPIVLEDLSSSHSSSNQSPQRHG